MTRNLPPLTALRAFEAAARHLSFTKAADELAMTQSAISYQIKLLEERIGSPLFLRLPRQVALTEAGERLAPAVTQAFDLLGEAFVNTRNRAEGLLAISSVPTFASQFLVQRLGLFHLAHPGIAVRLDSNPKVIDFAADEIDVVIRAGTGPYPGMVSHLLLKAQYTAMIGPTLAQTIGPLTTPADLLALPMVDGDDPWFEEWFKAAGITDYAGRSAHATSTLGSQNLSAGAVMAGHGITMLTPAFYRAELADGRLIQPFDILAYSGGGYWLLYPEARRNSPKIRAFRDWLLEQTAPLRAD